MQIAANPDAKASNKPNRRTLIELSCQIEATWSTTRYELGFMEMLRLNLVLKSGAP
jgi:hypothetical protein